MDSKVRLEIACLLEAAQALGKRAVERLFGPTRPLHAIIAVPDLDPQTGIELAHFALRGQHPFGQSTARSELSVEQLQYFRITDQVIKLSRQIADDSGVGANLIILCATYSFFILELGIGLCSQVDDIV